MITTRSSQLSTNSLKSVRTSTQPTAKPADAVRLLKEDHREVGGWFKEYKKLKNNISKQKLADKIFLALTIHMQIEEEIFYPAVRAGINDDALLNEAEVEHAGVKKLIAELQEMKAGDRLFDAKVTVLGEYITHHVKEEETDMFPESRKSDLDLKALGRQMADRKAELTAQAKNKLIRRR